MTKRWIPFALVLILTLAFTACEQRPEPEEPVPSEVATEPETEATTEATTEPETEAETEPETEAATEATTEAPTEAATETATEPTTIAAEPVDPAAYSGASTGLKLNAGDFDLFGFRPGFEVSWFQDHDTAGTLFAAVVNRSTVAPASASDPNMKSDGDFMALMPGYKKALYSLIGGNLVVDGNAYQIAPEDYAAMKNLYDDPALRGPTYPQWLVYMDLSRVTGARFLTEESGEVWTLTSSVPVFASGGQPLTDGELQLQGIINMAHYFPVVPSSGAENSYVQREITPKGNTFKLWLDFDGGTGQPGDLFYTLTFEENILLVESSDLGYGCQYSISPEMAGRLRGLLDVARAPADAPYPPPEVAKPVIYLYPEKAMDVNVKLDFKGELGFTFPAYNGGWNVTAKPGGELTNKADGSTHYYLFWDGTPDKTDWDFSKGFVVKGSEVEAFFREKLPALGLLPKEYNDFITFWTPRMQKNAYNLVAFSTEEYEAVAPLAVTPAPDTMLRVHMVYKPLDAPVPVEPQVLPVPPERDGFTVVEWGGTELGGKTA